MKGHHFLYSLGAIAVVGVLTCFLVSATGTFPERFWKQQPPVETIPLVRSQEKKCGCCKKSMDRIRKRIQQAGERKRALKEKETAAPSADSASVKSGKEYQNFVNLR